MNISLLDILGSIGAGLVVLSYWALQSGRIQATQALYSIANALGAGLILCSLLVEFNLSAFLIELFWLIISLYGLFNRFRPHV